MTMVIRRSPPKRGDPNDPQTRDIRFDYSDIRLENEFLDFELEQRESSMHRQQFRKTVDSEETYQKAKKNADEMLQLKNAVNSRKPHTSFERVSKSAGARPKSKTQLSKQKTSSDLMNIEPETMIKSDDFVDGGTNEDIKSEKSDESDEKPASKPFNNLTMFLLSLQRFKSAGQRVKHDQKQEGKDTKEDKDKTKTTDDIPCRPPPRPCPRAKSAIQAGVAEKYGIHVKKDHSRSRRTLGEISKLEHDSKYGHVDKYEQRRKKLLAACKDTDGLEKKINIFLKKIDVFKKESAPDNSLERVLMRSKSAFCRRTPPDW